MTLKSYLLGSDSDEVLFETIELTHSDFTQPLRFVRNHNQGLVVTLETDESAVFDYIPLAIDPSAKEDDLVYSISVTLGDLGELLPAQFANIIANDNMLEPPKLVYRAYRATDLENVLIGPINLTIKTFNFNRSGATFEAESSRDDINGTGVTYNLSQFWTARGFIKEINV